MLQLHNKYLKDRINNKIISLMLQIHKLQVILKRTLLNKMQILKNKRLRISNKNYFKHQTIEQ